METIGRKELHEKIHEFLAPLYVDNSPANCLIVSGNDGIGKTSIIMEEAALLGDKPKGEVDLEEPRDASNYCVEEFDKFFALRLRYSDREHCEKVMKGFVASFMMQRAAPMMTDNPKSVIVVIDCSKADAQDIGEVFAPLPSVYYRLSKEEFLEWANTVNPRTGRENMNPLVSAVAADMIREI